MDTSRVSPTAHYTGTVWARNGLSHPVLSAALNPALYRLARPLLWAVRPISGGVNLEETLLQRHRAIDMLLSRAIEEQGVRQVVEIAAGMSARGLRFSERYRALGLHYIEGDLPAMAARKRAALDGAGLRGPGHEVRVVNALLDEGPDSLAAVFASLDPNVPTAIITEGLLLYLEDEMVAGLWARLGRLTADLPRAVYLFDLITRDSLDSLPALKIFYTLLSWVVRGAMHLHYADPAAAEAALRAAGFSDIRLHRASEIFPGVPADRPDVQRVAEVSNGRLLA